MNSFRSVLLTTVFVLLNLAFASVVHAQATRTWVSGVGDDINPCSRTAPCKTFAGAISKTAVGGEIDAIDSGGFGAVTITKSISIDGSGAMSSILGAGTTGIIVNITGSADAAKSVRIRGLAINGAGTGLYGIRVMAASRVTIEDSVIDGFTSDGVNIAAPGAQVFISNSRIRNNAGSGINVASAGGQAAMSDVSVVFNGAGLVTSGGGTIVSLRNNAVYGNKKDGEPSSSAATK
jgi:hypothetical protein